MTVLKQLWILAGGNGAGKSTFYEKFLEELGIKFVNADTIAKNIPAKDEEELNYKAATIAAEIRDRLLDQGISFCYETVFSHESKIDFVSNAVARGYEIILVYIHLDNPALNEARVHQRASDGGHSVPVEKIHSRIPRTMKHIAKVLPMVSEARLLDNSSHDDAFKQVAIVKKGKRTYAIDPPPDWAEAMLEEIP